MSNNALEPGLEPATELSLLDLVVPLAENFGKIFVFALACGLLALGVTYAIAPTYTARTSFLPPQQQQSAAASALASLGGALSGLAGGAAGLRTPADQYAALMQSVSVQDQIIDRFKLIEVYEAPFRADARIALQQNVRITVGRRDGLISVEVDDKSPQRAADIANQHVEELRRITAQLALTEAQQRRAFFEGQLAQTRDRLSAAQKALQGSGINAGALKVEPRSAAEGFARLRAEATAAEVRLQALRRSLTDAAPEVGQQLALVQALQGQLARLELAQSPEQGSDYVAKYREFKYQETLFELFSRQFELARLDESKEGALIQVVDVASPPEKKTKPRRGSTAIAATLVAGVLFSALLIALHIWRIARQDPRTAERAQRIRRALRLRSSD
jgi:uncharacterized protein involved in exopolysaccharide biosynthesis